MSGPGTADGAAFDVRHDYVNLASPSPEGIIVSVLAGLGYSDVRRADGYFVTATARDRKGRRVLVIVDVFESVPKGQWPDVFLGEQRLRTIRRDEARWLSNESGTYIRCDYFAVPSPTKGEGWRGPKGPRLPVSYVVGVSTLDGDVFRELVFRD